MPDPIILVSPTQIELIIPPVPELELSEFAAMILEKTKVLEKQRPERHSDGAQEVRFYLECLHESRPARLEQLPVSVEARIAIAQAWEFLPGAICRAREGTYRECRQLLEGAHERLVAAQCLHQMTR